MDTTYQNTKYKIQKTPTYQIRTEKTHNAHMSNTKNNKYQKHNNKC